MAVVIADIRLAMAVMVDMAAMEVTEAMATLWAPPLMDIAAMAAMVTAIAAMDMGMVMERDTAVGNILFINYI